MPRLPSSCYRLQLRNGTDFEKAAELLPYLARLGVSDLYLSPIFAAQPGSTHGYDVIDPTQIDSDLGGRHGFDRLADAAKALGIDIILDIVPNHVAFTLDNPWLRDVLAKGEKSRYFHCFDIMPNKRLALPMLEAPFEEILNEGGISVEAGADGPVMLQGDLRVPLDPHTVQEDLEQMDRTAIKHLHDRQFWRLCHWRTERDAITHRRFFNVTSLIGIRAEDPAVLDETHSLIFDLVESGAVAGLRIDHIDGLADPAAYLRRLEARLPDTPIWLEKILAPGESLPDWRVEGTTGYVLARDIAQVLTNGDGADRVNALYQRETGRHEKFGRIVASAKRAILETELAAELWRLQAMVEDLAADDRVASEYGPETWRQAILSLIAELSRYRTYLDGTTPSADDVAVLRDAADIAAEGLPDRRPLDFLQRVLLDPDPAHSPLRLRLQQVSGAVMAKGQEDTAFYRYNALLSANEVGAEPDQPAIDDATFHHRMQARLRDMPGGLSLTSSHDTKRSEDARMRIAALTHHPEAMKALTERAGEINGESVDPNLRWYLIQSLWAIHPGAGTPQEMTERLCAHATKAMREAKEGTSWQHPDDAYESAALHYAAALVMAFATLPERTAEAARTAERLSLAQLSLKLTLPGIPDIYQGGEIGNYRLTDPDNRAAVHFDFLATALDDPGTLSALDCAKLDLTRTILTLRRDNKEFFAAAGYEPDATSPDTLSFIRRAGGQSLRVVVSRGPALERAACEAGPGEKQIWPGSDSDLTGAVVIFMT